MLPARRMPIRSTTSPVRVALVGAGRVCDYHHVPALQLDSRAKLVAACDADSKLLEQRRSEWGLQKTTTRFEEICADPEIDALVIATPNASHRPIAVAAALAGKHVMCEKPLGLNAGEVREMYEAAREAGVVHMTAFTYRFAPSMRYLKHLVAAGSLGTAAALPQPAVSRLARDELGLAAVQKAGRRRRPVRHDDPSHRLRRRLARPDRRVCGALARFADRTKTADGKRASPRTSTIGHASSAISSAARPASGKAPRWRRATTAAASDTNGPRSTAPKALLSTNCTSRTRFCWARPAATLAPVAVPPEFLKPAGSPRNPAGVNRHRVSLRLDVGVRFRDCRRPRRRARASLTACEPKLSPTLSSNRMRIAGGWKSPQLPPAPAANAARLALS